jgi:uncharacterized surface protein with fasciclin (FAS1) repeats
MLALASLLSVSPLGFSTVPSPPACKTIAEILAETESLSTLNTVVNATPDVLAVLSNRSLNLTVFAPIDDAWLPFASYVNASGHEEELSEIFGGHAVSGVYTAEDLLALIPDFGEANFSSISTVNYQTIYLVKMEPESLFLGPVLANYSDAATVVVPNIKACNGIVHVIDKVLGDDDEGGVSDDGPNGSINIEFPPPELSADPNGRRRLRAKKEGKFPTLFEGKSGIKRRLQVLIEKAALEKKGGKAATSFTDIKHGI